MFTPAATYSSCPPSTPPVQRQLVRWDAEIGLLKETLDTSGRSAYDLAADPPTRDAMHTLFETAAAGRLDLVQVRWSMEGGREGAELLVQVRWKPSRL